MINTKIRNPISHILAPLSMRHSSQITFQESLGNMTTSVAAATQPTASGNIGITGGPKIAQLVGQRDFIIMHIQTM